MYTKKEILAMDDAKLLNAYTYACYRVAHSDTKKDNRVANWMRDELAKRLGFTIDEKDYN